MKRILIKGLLVVATIIFCFVILVFLTAIYYGFKIKTSPTISHLACSELALVSQPSNVDPTINSAFDTVKIKLNENQKPTRSEYIMAGKEVVKSVKAPYMGLLNGTTCGSVAYVRDDLPNGATLYVRRHELEHILKNDGGYGDDDINRAIPQIYNAQRNNMEYETNLAAAKTHPIGMAETVIFTLVIRYKYSRSWGEYINSLISGFRTYFIKY